MSYSRCSMCMPLTVVSDGHLCKNLMCKIARARVRQMSDACEAALFSHFYIPPSSSILCNLKCDIALVSPRLLTHMAGFTSFSWHVWKNRYFCAAPSGRFKSLLRQDTLAYAPKCMHTCAQHTCTTTEAETCTNTHTHTHSCTNTHELLLTTIFHHRNNNIITTNKTGAINI